MCTTRTIFVCRVAVLVLFFCEQVLYISPSKMPYQLENEVRVWEAVSATRSSEALRPSLVNVLHGPKSPRFFCLSIHSVNIFGFNFVRTLTNFGHLGDF